MKELKHDKLKVISLAECIDHQSTLLDVLELFSKSPFRRFPIISKNNEIIGGITDLWILNQIFYAKNVNQKLKEQLEQQTLIDVPLFKTRNLNLAEIITPMYLSPFRAILCQEKTGLIYIYTERDLLLQVYEKLKEERLPIIKYASLKHVYTVNTSHSIKEAIKIMLDRKTRHIVVVNDERKIDGILTASDVLQEIFKMIQADRSPTTIFELPVKTIMSSPVTVAESGVPVKIVLEIMKGKNIGAIPLTDSLHVPQGIFTEHDVAKIVLEKINTS